MAQRFDATAGQATGELFPIGPLTKFPGSQGLGAFSVADSGVLAYHRGFLESIERLTWRSRNGARVATAGEPGWFANLDLSPNGKRVAVSARPLAAQNMNIWIIDVARGDGVPLTTDPAREFDPNWSPDGSEVAFVSDRTPGRSGIWRRPSSGSGEDEVLVPAESNVYVLDWSPHGVLFSRDGDLWIRRLDGRQEASAIWKTQAAESDGAFSPDGHWIAYVSDKSGRREIYVRAFPSGKDEHRVSLDGGVVPRWRDDGTEIFFLSPDSTLMAAPVETAKGFRPMTPQPLFRTGLVQTNKHAYAVARDGQQFLMPMPVDSRGTPPISVILNWEGKLPKQ